MTLHPTTLALLRAVKTRAAYADGIPAGHEGEYRRAGDVADALGLAWHREGCPDLDADGKHNGSPLPGALMDERLITPATIPIAADPSKLTTGQAADIEATRAAASIEAMYVERATECPYPGQVWYGGPGWRTKALYLYCGMYDNRPPAQTDRLIFDPRIGVERAE